MLRSHSVVAWAVAVWFLAVCAVFAEETEQEQEKPSADPPPIRTAEAAIERALDTPTQMEFVDAPLSEVIEFLKDYHHIEVQADNRALADVGIGTDTPITINLKGISLRSALKLILREHSLTWIIQDEVLLITTPEEAESQLTTKVLDVSDLVVCYDMDDEPWDDYGTLINTISRTLRSATWNQFGGPGSITGASLGTAKVLVVSQTREMHREIAQLLANIRAIAEKNPDEELPQRERNPTPPKLPMGGGKGMF